MIASPGRTILYALLVLPAPSIAQLNVLEEDASLTSRWELSDTTQKANFLIRPHKPVYFLPFYWSSDPNEQPTTDNPETSLPVPIPLQPLEFKFQFSFKFKVWRGIFGHNGDLWLGYTQSSRWQMYNAGLSRLFRETNYEPEAILNFRTNVKLLGFRLTMLGGGVNHQSNGRSFYLTRSWNRVIGQVGFERENWAILLRPWMRVKEDIAVDENPRIDEYIGRGDLLVVRSHKGHQISALARHSLDFKRGHASIQLDWAIPVTGYFKAHVQFFMGNGESMIDYNHRQTMVGLGFSLMEWM
ncbi:MAG TPA: phospholipase A [Flavobacteriales bacterium]|nr:phospholipase A [Flavobacteriales bacterium]